MASPPPSPSVRSPSDDELRSALDATRTELEETRQLLHSIEAGAADFIIVTDPGGRMLFINRTLPGMQATEVLGTRVFDWVPVAFHERMRQTFAEVGRTGAPGRYEVDYHGQGGELIVFETRVGAIRRDGQVVAFTLCASDVSAARREEQALRRSQERWRSLAESLPDLICTVDAEGRLLFSNRALAPGPTPGDLFEHLPASAHDELRRCLSAVFAGSAECGCEVPDGRGGYCQVRVVPFGGKPTPVVALLVITDVTEARRLREQLLLSQRMEAVGRLAGGVAHDFNNLLMVIGGHAQLLRQRRDDPELDAIVEASEQAATLTGQLLAFSRREHRPPEVIDLDACVRRSVGLLRRTLGETVELCHEPAAGPLPVLADPHLVQQLLINLALNARDAMPEGGRLSIALSPTGDRQVELVVSDEGCGIPAEHRERIFEPFFTTKERGKGTGLGLSTVLATVQQAGGEISVRSEPGRGATFTVVLPLSDQQPDAERAAVMRHRPGVRSRLLLVEDEPAVRELLVRVLREAGHEVLAAARPSEALAIFAREGDAIDLLVTDVVLPEMGGRELAQRLRTERPGLPVLFQSGYDPAGALPPDLADVAFLVKPFSPRVLVDAVAECMATARR